MALSEISLFWNQILTTLIAGPLAWRTPTELARALGHDLDALTDELASMDAAGWLDVWERPEPEEIAVTLSAWGAGRLGVRLAESGGGLSLRWVEVNQPEPSHFRARGVTTAAALEELDLVLDSLPAPGAWSVELDDDPTPRADGPPSPTSWFRPTRLLGEGLTPWPGPGASRERSGVDPNPCPACRGDRLGVRVYCLHCDRWGLDHLLQPVTARERPRPNDRERDEQKATRKLRDHRKARRRSRLQARFATEAQPHQTRRRAS